MTKLYAQRKDVFDIDKVTVVGSPTITSDGVVSGFSSGNYIQLPCPIDGTKDFKIQFPFSTTSITSQATLITANKTSVFTFIMHAQKFILYIGDGSKWIFEKSSTNAFGGINPKLVVTIEKKGYDYTVKIKDESTGIETIEIQYTATADMASFDFLSMGNAQWWTIPQHCTYYLEKLFITVDGELVYSPTKPTYLLERRKEGFDLSKFTVVGSPTITESGVASGFSNSNYVGTIPLSNLINKSWEITSPIVTNVNSQNYGINACQLAQQGYGADGGIYFTGTSKSIMFRINTPSDDTPSVRSNNRISIHKTLDTLPERIQFKFSFNYTTGTYTGYYNIFDGKGWQIAGSITPTTIEKQLYDIVYNSSNDIKVGTFDDAKQLNVNLDLSQFSITVDGKEVFTGAKEKFYAMRGGR